MMNALGFTAFGFNAATASSCQNSVISICGISTSVVISAFSIIGIIISIISLVLLVGRKVNIYRKSA